MFTPHPVRRFFQSDYRIVATVLESDVMPPDKVPVESVTEIIGSILRTRCEAHNVSLNVFKEEVKIGWQGPAISHYDGIVSKCFSILPLMIGILRQPNAELNF